MPGRKDEANPMVVVFQEGFARLLAFEDSLAPFLTQWLVKRKLFSHPFD